MIGAIILAAGRSRRMGQQKLLLPLGGTPMITRIVEVVLDSPVDQTLVVVGAHGKEIAEALGGRRITLVTNPEAEGEMLSSVRCGLRALPGHCETVLVVLGDQPGITRAVIRKLVQAHQAGQATITVPTYHGQRGHPICLSMRHRDEILNRFDQEGLRGLLLANSQHVQEIDVASPVILEDMDEPEDYARMRLAIEKRPSEFWGA